MHSLSSHDGFYSVTATSAKECTELLLSEYYFAGHYERMVSRKYGLRSKEWDEFRAARRALVDSLKAPGWRTVKIGGHNV